jgi:hypothetical protein
LQRLKGVYVILNILPNDKVGGIIKSVEDDGKVIFGMKSDMTTNTKFIRRVIIPNEDDDAYVESPLIMSFKKARIKVSRFY